MKSEGIKTLDLKFSDCAFEQSEPFFSKHGKSLKTLRLIFSEFRGLNYYKANRLPKNFILCENLEELCISTKFEKQHLKEQDFIGIASLRNLKILKILTGFENTDGLECFINLTKSSFLEKLELEDDSIHFDKSKSLNEEKMTTLLKKCPKLRSIKLAVGTDLWDLSNEYLLELCKSRNTFICFDHIKLCDDICVKEYDEDLPKRQYSMMKFFHEQDPRTLKKYIEMENVYLRYNVKNLWTNY